MFHIWQFVVKRRNEALKIPTFDSMKQFHSAFSKILLFYVFFVYILFYCTPWAKQNFGSNWTKRVDIGYGPGWIDYDFGSRLNPMSAIQLRLDQTGLSSVISSLVPIYRILIQLAKISSMIFKMVQFKNIGRPL